MKHLTLISVWCVSFILMAAFANALGVNAWAAVFWVSLAVWAVSSLYIIKYRDRIETEAGEWEKRLYGKPGEKGKRK